MGFDKELYSPYIESGIVKHEKYRLFRYLVGLLFRRIELDKESKLIIDEHTAKGKIVYASMQTTFTSLYILTNLLEKHDLPVPDLALGFRPYTYQKFVILFNEIKTYLRKLFKAADYSFVPNHVYLSRTLEKGNLAFSMFSKRLFLRRYVEIKTDTLEYLLEIQKSTETPIFIFPQVIFWNRNPERPGSLMYTESIGDRGLITGVLALWKSITPAFVRIGKPVNLKDILDNCEGDDIRHLSRIVRNNLVETYNHEKRTILGPVLKSKQEMMEKILYHRNVLEAIQQEISEKGTREKKLRRMAYRYFVEIAADFSMLYIKFFKGAMDYIYRKIFDGIYFNIEDFKKLREEATKGTVVLVPSHKSHMDYLVISCMLYDNNFIPPHIVAGANLIFFPMGTIFRKSGAFFMRRTFKGLNLYASVFKQYVKTLVNEGYIIEVFIEGGRSRTGKIIQPKMGILKYLIEAIDEGYNKDLVFVPLTVNYDRILEENSYLKELKGKEKSAESTSSFVKSSKLMKRKYGSVYMGFNDTFTLSEVREKFLKEKNISDIDVFTSELGYYIVKRINEAVIATPFSVATAAMLDMSPDGFSRSSLKERMENILNYLAATGHKTADSLKDLKNINGIIDFVYESLSADGIISRTGGDESGKEKFLLNDEQRGRINFYKNSILHMTLPLNMLSLAVLVSASKGKASKSRVTAEVEKIRDMLSREFVYPDIIDDTERLMKETSGYLQDSGLIRCESKSIIIADEAGESQLRFFAGMLQEYFESYSVVLEGISEMPGSPVPRKEFLSTVRKTGLRMFDSGSVKFSESLSAINYNNAIDRFIEYGILRQEGDQRHSLLSHDSKEKSAEYIKLINSYLDVIKR